MLSNNGKAMIKFHADLLAQMRSADNCSEEAVKFQEAYLAGFTAGMESEAAEQGLFARMGQDQCGGQ